MGGTNFTEDDSNQVTFNPTASFQCGDDGHSGLWGPSYPNYREADLYKRGQYEFLEAYVHYSAPEGKVKN